MEYQAALEQFYKKLGKKKIMALATSLNDHVTVRNVSCLIYDKRLFFKTDKEFRKTKQLIANPNVAICHWGVQMEGTAVNHGLVIDEPEQKFQTLYEKYWKTSYTAYPHRDTEILIEVVPRFVEIWDQDENDRGFQLMIDFDQQTAEKIDYD
ncbi:hypothetical protein NRIC_16120 [Enterococcus florum]|uniref:Pyridoxamine 5'-phosphate oxidase N-terminal domain-containing protein n=1 Tax=Enterococcus florum TaxID=2480627 RepID=A0A4P5PBR2_9ENTE|nr:pyridoxamine 5'-phosphate oxidase family protein [Enterococcus florum]GCF93721.1 hypothetical protein NRIC_16120 [Enterococcus florum]